MASTKSILIVDDEPRMRRFVRMNLELEGFTVSEASDGLEAVRKVREESPNLVVLDVEMPHLDGFETLAEIRRTSPAPVIMLTVRGEEEERIKGLDLGADDYVTKPFSIRELLARVRAILRRVEQPDSLPSELRFDDVAVDFLSYEASKGGQRLEMTPKEFSVLRLLAARPGQVITRDELLNQVWGYDKYPTTRTVDNHIASLRAKLENDTAEPEHLKTVHGVGYKFVF